MRVNVRLDLIAANRVCLCHVCYSPKAILIDHELLETFFGTRGYAMSGQGFRRLQERYNDPLLTALAVMLVVLLFVVGPLQAAGVVAAHEFGIAFGLVLVAAVFIVSGSGVALAAVLFAVALIVLATVMRLRQPSVADIYLELDGVADRWPDAKCGGRTRGVRARTRDVPSRHRGGPPVSLYRAYFRSVVLLCDPSHTRGFNRYRPFSGQFCRCWQPDLLQLRDFNVGGLWRHRPVASICAWSR